MLLLHLLPLYVGYFHTTLGLGPLFCSATPQTPILAALFAGGALLLVWLQRRDGRGIKKQRIEDLTDEIMFYAEYYDNKLNAKGFVPRKKLIPVEVENIPHIREAIRQRLMQEVSP